MDRKSLDQFKLLSDESSKEEIINAFKALGNIGLNQALIPKGLHVFRTRLGSSKLEPKSFSELSYNPFVDNIGIGRANTTKHQVFYGCTHPNRNRSIQSALMELAVFEGSGIYRERKSENGAEMGCLSKWELSKNLKLVAFLNYDFGPSTDAEIIKYREELRKKIFAQFEFPELIWELNGVLSSMFANIYKPDDPFKYKRTSLVSKLCMINGYDGVLFPSVLGHGRGFNIAINTSAANSLELKYVAQIVNIAKSQTFYTFYTKDSKEIRDGKILNWKSIE